MNVTFSHIGLDFAAEVDYEPYIPAQLYGLPENCAPAEGGTVEITDLTCGGKDAMFLMGSDLADDITGAAYDAAEASIAAQREQAEEDRAADRAFERGYGVWR